MLSFECGLPFISLNSASRGGEAYPESYYSETCWVKIAVTSRKHHSRDCYRPFRYSQGIIYTSPNPFGMAGNAESNEGDLISGGNEYHCSDIYNSQYAGQISAASVKTSSQRLSPESGNIVKRWTTGISIRSTLHVTLDRLVQS